MNTRTLLVASLLLLVSDAIAAPPYPAQPSDPPSASTSPAPPESASPAAQRSQRLFVEAWQIVSDHFYDPSLHGVDWPAVRDELLPRAGEARGRAAVSRVINTALDRLGASHTRHYIPDQREYYELLDVFYPDGVPPQVSEELAGGRIVYIGVGVASTTIDGRVYAADVYPGSPADEGGLRVGDELVAVEGSGGPLGPLGTARRPWGDISPFRGRAGVPTRVFIRRDSADGPEIALTLTPRRIQPRKAFALALERSARVIEHDGRRFGYARVRSYAHPDYQEALLGLINTRFRDCDGLILDLRGGWGGAKAEYLAAFNPAGVRMDWRSREDEEWHHGAGPWTGPMVTIIDHGTRSGKEMLAHGLTTSGRAVLVGETTAGAVLAGRPFILSDNSLLMVAVSDVRVSGVRLEGVGVEPHIPAGRPLPYANGADGMLEVAVQRIGALSGPPKAR